MTLHYFNFEEWKHSFQMVEHTNVVVRKYSKIRWLLSWLGKVPRKALDIQIFPLPNFTTKLLFSMGNHGMRRSSFFLLLFYSLSRIGKGGFYSRVVRTSFFVGSWFTVGGCIDVSGADIWERKGGKFMIAISECLHYSVSSLAYITYQNPLSLVLHDNCKSFWDTTIWEGQVLFQKRLLMSWDL